MSDDIRDLRKRFIDDALHEIADDDAALRKIAEDIVRESGMDMEIDQDFLDQLRADALAIKVNTEELVASIEELGVAALVEEELQNEHPRPVPTHVRASVIGATSKPERPSLGKPRDSTPESASRHQPKTSNRSSIQPHQTQPQRRRRSEIPIWVYVAILFLLLSLLIGSVVYLAVTRDDDDPKKNEVGKLPPPSSAPKEHAKPTEPKPVAKVERKTRRFQNGKDGYDDKQCTVIEIFEVTPDKQSSPRKHVNSDQNGKGGKSIHVLIRFQSILEYDSGKRTLKKLSIKKAVIRFFSVNPSNGDFAFHEMLLDWDKSTTWNSLGEGVTPDGKICVKEPTANVVTPSSKKWIEVDVTSSVNAWQSGERKNYGWGIVPKTTDGWDFVSPRNDEFPHKRPELVITYGTP